MKLSDPDFTLQVVVEYQNLDGVKLHFNVCPDRPGISNGTLFANFEDARSIMERAPWIIWRAGPPFDPGKILIPQTLEEYLLSEKARFEAKIPQYSGGISDLDLDLNPYIDLESLDLNLDF